MTTFIPINLRKPVLALVVASMLAGCGGNAHHTAPKLPAALADQLARKSDEVGRKLAAGDECGALESARELQAQATAAVGGPLRAPLLAAAADLTRRISCAPPPKKKPPKKHEHEHGKGKKH